MKNLKWMYLIALSICLSGCVLFSKYDIGQTYVTSQPAYIPKGYSEQVGVKSICIENVVLNNDLFGMIAKSKISDAGFMNGPKNLEALIKNDVVEDVSATEVRLKLDLDQKESIVRKITGYDFIRIWGILHSTSKKQEFLNAFKEELGNQLSVNDSCDMKLIIKGVKREGSTAFGALTFYGYDQLWISVDYVKQGVAFTKNYHAINREEGDAGEGLDFAIIGRQVAKDALKFSIDQDF